MFGTLTQDPKSAFLGIYRPREYRSLQTRATEYKDKASTLRPARYRTEPEAESRSAGSRSHGPPRPTPRGPSARTLCARAPSRGRAHSAAGSELARVAPLAPCPNPDGLVCRPGSLCGSAVLLATAGHRRLPPGPRSNLCFQEAGKPRS